MLELRQPTENKLKIPERKSKMKKAITYALVLAFVVSVASVAFSRTLEEEKAAVRSYLSVIDAKIVKYRKAGNTAKMRILQADKKATLLRWEKLKQQMEVAPAAPPSPAPGAPAPTIAGVGAMGLSLGGSVGLKAGLFDVAGVLNYSTENILPGTAVRVGVDYLSGNNPNSASTVTADNPMKALNVSLGATYALTMLKSADIPINWYVGADYVIPVKVNGSRTGTYGGDVFVGGTYNVPDFGTLYGELGYGALKYASGAAALKGIDASIGYSYAF